ELLLPRSDAEDRRGKPLHHDARHAHRRLRPAVRLAQGADPRSEADGDAARRQADRSAESVRRVRARARAGRRETLMARLKSELEVTCPCCQSTLVIDTNLGRVVSHKEPERGDKPELTEAQRILAEQAARREAIFQQSVDAEKTRGDALSKRFEEALRQAREEPITKPVRDFDLD